MKKAAFCSLGCKVNQYETDAMQQLFKESGYEVVPFEDYADVYIVNTCTVTSIADRKSRQMLHRAKKNNPESLVVAVGCYVQTDTNKLEKDELVDLLIGNNRKKDIVAIIDAEMQSLSHKDAVIDIANDKEYETLSLGEISDHTRAYIKIQDGCNQFCSYCIIPVARGRVRSRKYDDIINEINGLKEKGYKEIVLTGIHISSYGLDFEGSTYNLNSNNEHLINLIEGIAKDTGIERIRLGSLEPRIVTEEFAKRLAAIESICPHFHLSLQSGCDETLKRMNRHYTADEFYEGCENLRKYFDKPAITTDVIVGFPGETDEEFDECRAFLKKVGFYQMHIFKYSKRAGTKAAAMKEQIHPDIKHKRSQVLLSLSDEMEKAFAQDKENKPCEVLAEEEITLKGHRVLVGHTKEYIRTYIDCSKGKINEITRGNLVKVGEDYYIEA